MGINTISGGTGRMIIIEVIEGMIEEEIIMIDIYKDKYKIIQDVKQTLGMREDTTTTMFHGRMIFINKTNKKIEGKIGKNQKG